jgi:hypothetical protein
MLFFLGLEVGDRPRLKLGHLHVYDERLRSASKVMIFRLSWLIRTGYLDNLVT